MNASDASTEFVDYNITMSMEGPDTFKPGIPYNGKVRHTSAISSIKFYHSVFVIYM